MTSVMIDPFTAQTVEVTHLTRDLKIVDHGTSIDLYRTLSYLPRIVLSEEELEALVNYYTSDSRKPLKTEEVDEAIEEAREVGERVPPPMAKRQRLPKIVELSTQARRLCNSQGGSNDN